MTGGSSPHGEEKKNMNEQLEEIVGMLQTAKGLTSLCEAFDNGQQREEKKHADAFQHKLLHDAKGLLDELLEG